MWASLVPVKKPGSVCRVRVTQNTLQVSAISLECCPPSAWNTVRHHAGTLSAISMESCPPSRGIRILPPLQEDIPPLPDAIAAFKDALARCREAEEQLAQVMTEGGWLQ